MAAEVMKVEVEAETCCICGGGGELMTPEEHDAGAPPMQVPLRAMLLHLNSSKVVPDGRLCGSCIRRALESYEFSTALSNRGTPPLSEKIRALRKRLHELTQKIDVFIVVGGAGPDGAYSEEDIIMVERDTLAAAAAADNEELERGRNARGDHVYQCSVCPASFPKPNDFRTHLATHPADSLHSCWTCGAQFATRAALKAHLGASLGSLCGASLSCQLCGRGAGSAAELRRHGAACPARCPACGAVCADRAALSAHAAAAHGRAAPPPHVCPTCFRTADTPELLSAHLLRHRQAKQFVCGYDACILRFGTRSNLMSHIRKCHTSEETEAPPAAPSAPSASSTTCDTCGRTFGSVAAMKRHSRVHRSTHVNNLSQEEGTEFQEGEDMEGEVEYLEVEELEELEYRDQYDEDKSEASMH
ncbi:unnamed protein product [Arctia plantaginis]|uniref:C2H2-type domain-containing protein n=1 Tax=Arctia plantaginis TaxID=874455 RepID=A0A8S1B9S1_ARCPL|nr:unnamed protein product [Arctia plantaginis]CAB3255625.1 unnamed protein product [Arctia plantaginis]